MQISLNILNRMLIKKAFEGAVIEAYNKLEGVCDGKVSTLKIKAFLTTNFGLDVQNGWIQSVRKEGLKDFYLKKIIGEPCVLKKQCKLCG
eukprot:snap_masked-scaffold_1-processed-gene-3.18-mRNA-1 protein AED:1.00 eAED:1.00 QI:0/-1/0/0/-1/1/1/0/89